MCTTRIARPSRRRGNDEQFTEWRLRSRDAACDENLPCLPSGDLRRTRRLSSMRLRCRRAAADRASQSRRRHAGRTRAIHRSPGRPRSRCRWRHVSQRERSAAAAHPGVIGRTRPTVPRPRPRDQMEAAQSTASSSHTPQSALGAASRSHAADGVGRVALRAASTLRTPSPAQPEPAHRSGLHRRQRPLALGPLDAPQRRSLYPKSLVKGDSA